MKGMQARIKQNYKKSLIQHKRNIEMERSTKSRIERESEREKRESEKSP